MDTALFFKEVRSKHDFTDDELARIVSYMGERVFIKNQIIYQPGDIVNYICFIRKGIVRQYFMSADGVERTIDFFEEGRFVGELTSFLFKEPTQFYCQALENTDVLYFDRQNWEIAFSTIPAMAIYQLKLHARFIFQLKQEMGMSFSNRPDDKYLRLMEKNPGLLQRLPQYHIASYLGVTPETLSRIRQRMKSL